MHRLPRLRRDCFGGERGVPTRRHGVKSVIVATSGKLTNTCGRGVIGLRRRVLSGPNRRGLFIIKRLKHRCFTGGSMSVSAGFHCAIRGPAVRHTHSVSTIVLSRFGGRRLSRICMMCAQVRGTIRSRTRILGLLPLREKSFNRVGVPLGVCHRRVRLGPSPVSIVGDVMPDCVGNVVCKYLIRTCTDRRGTHVVTVGSTASDTRSLVGSLSVLCGETERTTVARRVARIYTNTETRRGGDWGIRVHCERRIITIYGS